MAAYILYINSSMMPFVFSPLSIYQDDSSYRVAECSGQAIFQSSVCKQPMNIEKKNPPSVQEKNHTAFAQNKNSTKKRVRRYPRSLTRLLEITARQDALYQQQLFYERLHALENEKENSLNDAKKSPLASAEDRLATKNEPVKSIEVPITNEKSTLNTLANGLKHGDKISLSHGSSKIGEGHFIEAGSNYLVWEHDGDKRLQYMGDEIHIEKL